MITFVAILCGVFFSWGVLIPIMRDIRISEVQGPSLYSVAISGISAMVILFIKEMYILAFLTMGVCFGLICLYFAVKIIDEKIELSKQFKLKET